MAPAPLKPIDCPFCGQPGYSRTHEEMPNSFMAGCSDPDCIAHLAAFDFISEQAAIAAWNKRTGSPAAKSFARRLEGQAKNVEGDGWLTAARLMRQAAFVIRGS
jgi:hypothetical protein